MYFKWFKLTFSAVGEGTSILEVYENDNFVNYLPPVGDSPYTQKELDLLKAGAPNPDFYDGSNCWTSGISTIDAYRQPREWWIKIPINDEGIPEKHCHHIKVRGLYYFRAYCSGYSGPSEFVNYYSIMQNWKKKVVPSLIDKQLPPPCKIKIDNVYHDEVIYSTGDKMISPHLKIYNPITQKSTHGSDLIASVGEVFEFKYL